MTPTGRRRFLRFALGSPLFAGGVLTAAPAGSSEPLIASPEDAVDVFDLRAVARAKLPPAHYDYLEAGADGGATRDANHDAIVRLRVRPRRLVDVTTVDTGLRLFGESHATPILLCPAGSQKAFHPDGELATQFHLASLNHGVFFAGRGLMALSTVLTDALVDEAIERLGAAMEDVAAAAG